MRLGGKREKSVNIVTSVGDGKMVPWVLSWSLHPSALVWVCVHVCVCVVKVSSMTPVTSAPLGLFFPLLPQLSLAHPLAALTGLLTLRASREMTRQRPAAVNTLRAHC